MADVAIVDNAVAAAPKDYVLKASQELQLKALRAVFDGAGAASAWLPCLELVTPSGEVMWAAVPAVDVAAGASADVSWFPDADEDVGTNAVVGVTVETLLLDTRNASGVTSATVLQAGVEYIITAQGTFSNVNHTLDVGTPNADALFPTSPPPARSTTQVGFDPECVFAYYSGGAPAGGLGHSTDNLQMNLGSGFAYVTPQDGTHATPSPHNLYTYKVVGQGSTASFKFVDNPAQYADNYGYIQITIQTLSGSSGGGGSGSLVPPAGSDNSLLRVVSGVAAWAAQPDVTEADLSLSDVATDNVSIARHGFAPKAPNDATKFLDGTGAYSVPGVSGGVSSLDALTGALVLAAGSGITITDNSPSPGDILITASGTGIVTELDYVEKTASVTVSATSDATATALIDGNAVTYNGTTRVKVEFWTPGTTVVNNQEIVFVLYDGATDLGRMGFMTNQGGTSGDFGPIYCVRFLTPSNGSHTLHVKAWKVTAGTSPIVQAAAGGAGINMPMWYRITTA